MESKESLYADKLACFKENERPEAVLIVADDAGLAKLVIAWPTVAVRTKEPPSESNAQTQHEWWDWLWLNTEYSTSELAARTGLMEQSLKRKLRLLIGNRVLYPDGSVNSFVQRYLREKVVNLFNTKPKKTTAKRT